MTDMLLTFNAGSSTIKIGIFELESGRPSRSGKAVVDLSRKPLTLEIEQDAESTETPLATPARSDLPELIREVLGILGQHFPLDNMIAVGHRIVHGGDVFTGPVLLDAATIEKIDALTQLAPLHQPQALKLIRVMKELRPDLVQTGSFDTTFHATQSDLVRRYAIPREWHDQGVKRYGFHGLSYCHVARALRERAPDIANGKVVIAHLGSGASLCAIEGGESRDTSMGFSTLDGIPMATRPGALDPGVLLHLLGPLGKSLAQLEDMLYHRSGLLGLSGISGDIRTLQRSDADEARQAIDVFALRVAGEICRLASTLGGLDALVFTAGIGEHQPEIRAAIVAHLSWIGVSLDADANRRSAETIGGVDSRVAVLIIPTDEEQMIAEECMTARQQQI